MSPDFARVATGEAVALLFSSGFGEQLAVSNKATFSCGPFEQFFQKRDFTQVKAFDLLLGVLSH